MPGGFSLKCCAHWYRILVFMSKTDLKKKFCYERLAYWKIINMKCQITPPPPFLKDNISSILHSMLIFQVHVIILLITRHH